MRILSIALLITLGLFYSVNAQVDLASARANAKTFIFDDGKHTVHGEVYRQLKEFTSCCGNDAIYLEVKFDQQGTVTSAKTLTGKNDCYKKSVIDIIRNVRWDATGVTGTKTIYFEVKPIIPCSGSPGENEYKPIAAMNVVASNESSGSNESSNMSSANEEVVEEVEEVVEETEEFVEEVAEEVVEEAEEVMEETEEVVAETTSDWNSDSFLSDTGSSSDGSGNPGKDAIKNRNGANNNGKNVIKNRNTTTGTPMDGSKPATAYSGPVKIPPQATDIEYVSKGERSPETSHRETFANVQGTTLNIPKYADGEGQFALQLRKSLRESGFCGLAQGLVSIEISPGGQVINTNMLAANNDRVREVVPGIVSTLRFSPQGSGANYRIYQEFKAEIVCKGQKPQYENLEAVPNIINVPKSSNP
ncbi:MAG: hypothetical protein AAGN35_22520 [Bacteroidota bacterium]